MAMVSDGHAAAMRGTPMGPAPLCSLLYAEKYIKVA